jgi:hypothetical protein
MQRNRMIPCILCGDLYSQGFAQINHARTCRVERALFPQANPWDEIHGPDFDESSDVSTDGDSDPSEDYVDLNSVEAHFDLLDELGTLDIEHVLQYLEWGKVELSAREIEVFRFLRSGEMGGGASGMSTRASLDYAKTLEGRGLLLPVTVRTCWAMVSKVSANYVLERSL